MENKIIIVSDSHGCYDAINAVVKVEWPFDCFVHCGDGVNDLIHVVFPEQIPVYSVSGNVDRARGIIGDDIITNINGLNLMITHGDYYQVKSSYVRLLQKGREQRVRAVLFGHTHRPFVKQGSPTLFNPGSVRDGRYGIIKHKPEVVYEHKSIP